MCFLPFCLPRRQLYTYYGNISGMRYGASGEITLNNIFNDNKPPCLLRYADPQLKEYIEARSMTDAEERYLSANYCYDSILKLHIIEIPASEQYQEEMKKRASFGCIRRKLSLPIPKRMIS